MVRRTIYAMSIERFLILLGKKIENPGMAGKRQASVTQMIGHVEPTYNQYCAEDLIPKFFLAMMGLRGINNPQFLHWVVLNTMESNQKPDKQTLNGIYNQLLSVAAFSQQ